MAPKDNPTGQNTTPIVDAGRTCIHHWSATQLTTYSRREVYRMCTELTGCKGPWAVKRPPIYRI